MQLLTGNTQQHQTRALSPCFPSTRQILELVGSRPSLSRISLVGNSLGGLYVRYAAKLLYNHGDAGVPGVAATIAGLEPSVFMTIACPHLGVRRFTYVPLPSLLHPLAGVFVGKTGADLFLSRNSAAAANAATSDNGGGGGGETAVAVPSSSARSQSTAAGGSSTGDNSGARDGQTAGGDGGEAHEGTGTARDGRESILLYSMGTSEEFLRPLKAFRWRRAYANRRGDFMVPYGTAAFLEPDEGDGSEAPVAGGGGGSKVGAPDPQVPAGTDARLGGAGAPRVACAPAVGTESFTIADRLLGAKHGAIVGYSRVGPAAPAGTTAVASGGQGERAQDESTTRTSDRIRRSAAKESAAGRHKDKEKRSMEEEMAAGLNSCGWEKVISCVFVGPGVPQRVK